MTPLLAKVRSLGDLRQRAASDPRYARLAIVAAENLGGRVRQGRHLDDPTSTDYALALSDAMTWLRVNANETGDERGVVEEVNFVRDLVDVPKPKPAFKVGTAVRITTSPRTNAIGRVRAVTATGYEVRLPNWLADGVHKDVAVRADEVEKVRTSPVCRCPFCPGYRSKGGAR